MKTIVSITKFPGKSRVQIECEVTPGGTKIWIKPDAALSPTKFPNLNVEPGVFWLISRVGAEKNIANVKLTMHGEKVFSEFQNAHMTVGEKVFLEMDNDDATSIIVTRDPNFHETEADDENVLSGSVV